MGAIIAGAMAGGGEAGERAGLQAQKQLGDQDLLKMRAEAEKDLARTAATLAQETHSVNTETDINAAPRRIAAETPAMVERERALIPVRAEGVKAAGRAETEVLGERLDTLAPKEREKKLGDLRALATPEATAAARKIALAGHIVDPQYTAVASDDGSVNMVNVHDAKDTKKLMVDGKAVVQKDTESRALATAALNYARSEKQAADAVYSRELQSGMDEAKAKAKLNEEYKRITDTIAAPALAVLTSSLKKGAPAAAPAAPAIVDPFKLQKTANKEPGKTEVRGKIGVIGSQIPDPEEE